MEEAAASLEKREDLAKMKEALQEGLKLLSERQKLIKIADRSDSGWLTAQEYMADEIADDSDDEKRIARAERQAEKLQKKRAGAPPTRKGGAGPGSGRYSFRDRRARVQEHTFCGGVDFGFGQYRAPAGGNNANRGTSLRPCFGCGRMGHLRRSCPLQ